LFFHDMRRIRSHGRREEREAREEGRREGKQK
jgi:hypothetical protein